MMFKTIATAIILGSLGFYAGLASAGDLDQPWKSSPTMIEKGKASFQVNCVVCHGAEGRGDGSASAAYNPKPRDFTNGAGWKKARKPSLTFQTITRGLSGTAMAGFDGLPAVERLALAHYVLSLGPSPEADSAADLKLVGIDPAVKGGGLADQSASIPIKAAIEFYAEDGKH